MNDKLQIFQTHTSQSTQTKGAVELLNAIAEQRRASTVGDRSWQSVLTIVACLVTLTAARYRLFHETALSEPCHGRLREMIVVVVSLSLAADA